MNWLELSGKLLGKHDLVKSLTEVEYVFRDSTKKKKEREKMKEISMKRNGSRDNGIETEDPSLDSKWVIVITKR